MGIYVFENSSDVSKNIVEFYGNLVYVNVILMFILDVVLKEMVDGVDFIFFVIFYEVSYDWMFVLFLGSVKVFDLLGVFRLKDMNVFE